MNEEIFERLKLEDIIWESCFKGKNLTFFSLEDHMKQGSLSHIFNGNVLAKNKEAMNISSVSGAI